MEKEKASLKTDTLFSIIIAQSVCVLLILALILTVKYFFKSTYNDFKKWYELAVCSETNINEVLIGEENTVEI